MEILYRTGRAGGPWKFCTGRTGRAGGPRKFCTGRTGRAGGPRKFCTGPSGRAGGPRKFCTGPSGRAGGLRIFCTEKPGGAPGLRAWPGPVGGPVVVLLQVKVVGFVKLSFHNAPKYSLKNREKAALLFHLLVSELPPCGVFLLNTLPALLSQDNRLVKKLLV